jgi:serine/threonine-protein kinase
VLLVLLLAIAGVAAAWQLGAFDPGGLPVPDVVNLSREDAEEAIEEAGFIVGEVTEENSTEIEEGRVIDQSPVPLATAERESPVDLIVSLGPKMTEVPDLVGKTNQEASALLREAGLASDVQTEFSTKPAGEVISQSPGAGEEVEAGSTIQYVISQGQKTVAVPDVSGRSRGNAEAALREAGFKVSVTEQFSDTVRDGRVISQNPGKGTVTVEGSTVTIIVSKGPEMIEVPDVIGASRDEAEVTLDNLGFEVEIVYEPHAENGTVLSQNPLPRTRVTRGSSVTIVVDAVQP